jgi:hypothetical protein
MKNNLQAEIQKIFKDLPSSVLFTHANGKVEKPNNSELFRAAFPQHTVCDVIMVTTGDEGFKFEGTPEKLQTDGWILVKNDVLYNAKRNTEAPYHQVWLHPVHECMVYYRVSGKKPGGAKKSDNIIDLWIGDNYIGEYVDGESIPVISDVFMLKPLGATAGPTKLWESIKGHLEAFKEKKSAKIGIISHDGREYFVKDFSLEGKVPDFAHADLHYGEGFEDFHNKLCYRIASETKGLILLHGEPGTGKTQYIRVLLDLIAEKGKRVLYVPPSFATHLMEPSMINFIGDWITEEESDVIMLIEDAEPLMETRSGDGRSTGISNLLNMTDGILNDMLGVMVIATFNTELDRIDSALLRPQRLIARKEFFRLEKENAQELATALNIEMPDIPYPATLAEFYTVKKSQEILIHGVKKEKKAIGFGRS